MGGEDRAREVDEHRVMVDRKKEREAVLLIGLGWVEDERRVTGWS